MRFKKGQIIRFNTDNEGLRDWLGIITGPFNRYGVYLVQWFQGPDNPMPMDCTLLELYCEAEL